MTTIFVLLSLLTLFWLMCGFLGAGIDLAFDIRYQPQPFLNYTSAVRGKFISDILRGPPLLKETLVGVFWCGWQGFLVPGRKTRLEARRLERAKLRFNRKFNREYAAKYPETESPFRFSTSIRYLMPRPHCPWVYQRTA